MDGSLRPGLASVVHTRLSEPGDLYAALRKSAPIRWCRSLVPDHLCLHQVGYIEINGTVIVSHCGSETDFLVEDTPHLHLLACFGGGIQLQTAGGAVAMAPGGCALLPTGLRRTSGSHSLVSVSIHPAALAAASAAMAGLPADGVPARSGSSVFAPLALAAGDRQAVAVHRLLRHIDACAAIGPLVASRLGLDDVLHRTVAAWRDPELLTAEPADLQRWRERQGRSGFDDLLDHIRANLDQPLRLSDLEARSHYSRRALQYAFRERLNTTPKQWIREQRLKQALEQFQGEGARPSVRAVALACGYGNVGHFSRDFRAKFGLNPSDARRR